MLSNTISELNIKINQMEFKWGTREDVYLQIDCAVGKTLRELLPNYMVYRSRDIKDNAVTRVANIYEKPEIITDSWFANTQYRPYIAIYYSVKLRREKIDGCFQYNLKNIEFIGDYDFELDDKFIEVNIEHENNLKLKLQELEQKRIEFSKYLDEIKDRIDKYIPLEETNYPWADDKVRSYVYDYKSLMKIKSLVENK